MASLLFSEEMAEATIKLASADVQSQETAADLFSGFIRRVRQQPGVRVVGADGKVGEMAKARFDSSDWWVAQQQVRRILPQILGFEKMSVAGQARLMSEVNEGLLLEGEIVPIATLDGLAVHVRDGCMVGAISLGLLPFVLPDGWAHRLGQCALDSCGKFFFRAAGKRGRQDSFCDRKHAVLKHVRAFRKRNNEG
jgi:hypothetical protein